MYTYNKIFVGIPLSQTNFGASHDLINELQPLASDEYALEGFEDFLEDEDASPAMKLFSQWVVDNLEELNALNIGLHHNYHGGDDYPEIFGVYVDEYFSIPDMGAQRADFSQIAKIEEINQKFKAIASKLNPEILKMLENEKLIGVWFNNHSS